MTVALCFVGFILEFVGLVQIKNILSTKIYYMAYKLTHNNKKHFFSFVLLDYLFFRAFRFSQLVEGAWGQKCRTLVGCHT